MTHEYKEGEDWISENGKVKLLPGSKAVSIKYEEIYPDAENPEIRTFKAVDGGYILSPEGSWFHDHQLSVIYKHSYKWQGYIPEFAEKLLPGAINSLKSGKSMKIMLLGDSISQGANASSKSIVPPYQPTWGELVAMQLRAFYGSDITYMNPSLGGTVASWGEEVAPSYITPEKPDLLIIAFGMNGGHPVEAFIKSIKFIMDSAKKGNPDVEFIVVTAMQLNEKWQALRLKRQYAEALRSLECKGTAIADMWAVHEELLKHKNFYDMTGNNVNHPNDYLIRWYAQIVAALLIP